MILALRLLVVAANVLFAYARGEVLCAVATLGFEITHSIVQTVIIGETFDAQEPGGGWGLQNVRAINLAKFISLELRNRVPVQSNRNRSEG